MKLKKFMLLPVAIYFISSSVHSESSDTTIKAINSSDYYCDACSESAMKNYFYNRVKNSDTGEYKFHFVIRNTKTYYNVTGSVSSSSFGEEFGGKSSGQTTAYVSYRIDTEKTSQLKELSESTTSINTMLRSGLQLTDSETKFKDGYSALAAGNDFLVATEDAILQQGSLSDILDKIKTSAEIIFARTTINIQELVSIAPGIDPQVSITLPDGSIVVVSISISMTDGNLRIAFNKIVKAYDKDKKLIPTTMEGLRNYSGTSSDVNSLNNYLKTINPSLDLGIQGLGGGCTRVSSTFTCDNRGRCTLVSSFCN